MKRGSIRKILAAFAVIVLIAILSIQRVDYTDFHKMDYFRQTMNRVDSGIFQNTKPQIVSAGWAGQIITPNEPVRLTGLRFKNYESVKDSVTVKAFLFADPEDTILLLTYDLWIIHPHLSHHIRDVIHDSFPGIGGIYFTATHTHSSIGGWASGLLGNLVVGGNNRETLDFIGDQTRKTVSTALQNLSEVNVSYGKAPTEGLVDNRLDRKNGPVDEIIRYLILENKEGQKAGLLTFQAHTVFLNRDKNQLSGDYPAPLIKKIEEERQIDFCAFASGAMGSHTPVIKNKDDSYEAMEAYAGELTDFFSASFPLPEDTLMEISFSELNIDMPPPTFRLSENLSLRPWIFDLVMGPNPARITCFRLGDIIMIGLPIELSGEFLPGLESIAEQKGLHLIITTFNGSYLGYAPVHKYYNQVKKAETRTMNWYGPYSGEYFAEVITQIINQL